jgi:hypothetical protein
MFLSAVPGANYENETRGYSAFEETLKRTERHELCPALRGCNACDADA